MAYNTGATFIPGGDDSYFMPEVISPAPQRVAEQPVNMQQNVAHMEHQAQTRDSRYPAPSPPTYHQKHPQNGAWQANMTPISPALNPILSSNQTSTLAPSVVYEQSQYPAGLSEVPNFSPFPALKNPGPNIPPTDEQKEVVLERAREAVLACNDPDQQLTWAQDALSYVEVAIHNEARVSKSQPARPRTPRIEHVLREDAMKVVSFLADQHHPKAEFMRGMWYEFGKLGCPLDKPESFQCYKRSADRGYARSWYRMGMQFESGNDPLTAIKYYRMAADTGDSAACYRLGMMTLLGQHGQVQDYEQGLQLIYAAAHTADDNAPQGAFVLGMLQAGELEQVRIPERYLPKSIAGAKVNIERAAFLGFAKAQVRMGAAYELGELGCPFDPALSLHYNALAARQGEMDAEMAISKWFLCGQEGVFEKSEEMAFTYAQRAAVEGFPTAQFAIGYFYEVGIYVQTDLIKAKEWYRQAEANGNKDARKRIDAVSRSKTISRKEHESVSLQRIRNQHGDRHPRPPSPPPLPSYSDALHSPVVRTHSGPQSPSLDMPDPSKLSIRSTTMPQRPGSTAPYPTEDTRINVPTTSMPDLRPTSAFGINPNLQRPSSSMAIQGGRQDHPGYGSPYPDERPYPSTNHGNGRQNYGGGKIPPTQGHAGGHGGSRPQQHLPINNMRPTSPYLNPANGPQSRPPPKQQQYQQRPAQQKPQAEDSTTIGFTAPLDSQGADRPNWKPVGSGSGEGPRPHIPRKDQSYQPKPVSAQRPLPSQQEGRPPANGGPQSFNLNRPPTTMQSTQPKPPQKQQPPPSQPPYQQPPQEQKVQAAHIKPSKPAANAPDDDATNNQRPSKVAAAAARPPGKGPKTFEEMGVPVAQKESDCVVM